MSEYFGPVKIDYSSFYKFVTSVGILLILAAAALPWFVFQLSIPAVEPNTTSFDLVEIAKDERASQYLWIVQATPWISAVLAISGLLVTIYGIVTWKKRQAKQDKDEDAKYEYNQEALRTTPASDDDKEEKLDEEAREDEEDTRSGAPNHGIPPSASRAPSDPERVQQAQLDPAHERNARREAILSMEVAAGEVFENAFRASHKIETNVKIDNGQSRILDIVAKPIQGWSWTSFAVEVKVVRPSPLVTRFIRDAMVSTAISTKSIPEGPIPTGKMGRPPKAKSVAICLVVFLESGEQGTQANYQIDPRAHNGITHYIEKTTEDINSILSRKVGVIAVPESKIRELGADNLRQLVTNVLLLPERASVVL